VLQSYNASTLEGKDLMTTTTETTQTKQPSFTVPNLIRSLWGIERGDNTCRSCGQLIVASDKFGQAEHVCAYCRCEADPVAACA
jgi:hypothetical protein